MALFDDQLNSRRLLALDVVRGCAMLLMLVSHTSWWINELEYRVAFGWDNLIVPALGSPESWLGYVLQLASPAFFLLAGFSIALFAESRRRRNWDEWQITRFFVVRGLVLITLDLTAMNIAFSEPYYHTRLSVLTGIGLCLCAMALLRRLPLRWLVVVMIAVLLGTQTYYFLNDWPREASLLRGALLAPSLEDSWFVQFPALPWLPVVMLGFISGVKVMRGELHLGRYAFRMGTLLFAVGVIVVAFNSFGNLYTDHPLIFGKHPPDMPYLFLYVGITFWLIALLTRFEALNHTPAGQVLAMLGQTALFFYVIHVRVIELLTPLLADPELPPLAQSFLITAVVLPIMLLLCLGYRAYKRQHPGGVLQYL